MTTVYSQTPLSNLEQSCRASQLSSALFTVSYYQLFFFFLSLVTQILRGLGWMTSQSAQMNKL